MSDYQGWTNYETWSVALIVNNDQGLQGAVHDMAREQREAAPDDTNVRERIWTAEQTERYRFADALKEFVREELLPDPLDSPPSSGESTAGQILSAQLLNAACDEIDWTELAESFLADMAELSA